MKKLIIAGIVSTAFMSSAAFAQSATDSTTLEVTGTVQNECSIADPVAVVFNTVNINEGAGANALLLKNGSQASTQSIYVSCNYAANLRAESANGGLLNSAGATLVDSDPLDFTNLIEYRVKLSPAGDTSFPVLDFRTLAGNTKTVTALGAFHNNATLEVRIDRDDTAKRPVAGTYTDVTTLTIGAV